MTKIKKFFYNPNFNYNLWSSVIGAYFSMYAFMKLFISVNEATTKRSVFPILFIVFFYAYTKIFKNQEKRQLITAVLTGTLFALFFTVGMATLNGKGISGSIETFGQIEIMLAETVGMAYLYAAILLMFTNYILSHDFALKGDERENRIIDFLFNTKPSFVIRIAIMYICWLPQLLTYYPGSLSYDSCRQIEMAAGLAPLTNHHPFIHTAFVSIFIKIGQAFDNDYRLGVALYTTVQMFIMAAIFSYTISFFTKLNAKPILKIALFVFFALFPFNGAYAITMWKDVLFGGFVLLLSVMLYKSIFMQEEFFKKKLNILALAFVFFLVATFRNNGYYVFLLMIPIFILFYKKHRLPVAIACVSALALVMIYKGPVFNALEVKEGSVAEMLSIPLQQIARVVVEHDEELTKEEKDKIDKFLPYDQLSKAYYPYVSDAVKGRLKVDNFTENKGEFIKLWVDLLSKYPKSYVDAFLILNCGYWFPDITYWVLHWDIVENKVGLKTDPLPGAFTSAEMTNLRYNNIIKMPIISMLYSVAIYVWLVVFAAALMIYKKQYKFLIPIVMLFFIWLTTIASPVYAEFRYAYSIILCAPLSVAVACYLGYKKPQDDSCLCEGEALLEEEPQTVLSSEDEESPDFEEIQPFEENHTIEENQVIE